MASFTHIVTIRLFTVFGMCSERVETIHLRSSGLPIREFHSANASAIAFTAASGGAEAITGPVKAVTGAAKDVVDIRKGVVETRLAEKHLEQAESLIQKATLEDVKQFDPKVRKLADFIRWSASVVVCSAESHGHWNESFVAHLMTAMFALRARDHRIVGKIRALEDCRLILLDRNRRIMAVYNPKLYRTYLPGGRWIGKGNQLKNVLEGAHRSKVKWRLVRLGPDHALPNPPVAEFSDLVPW